MVYPALFGKHRWLGWMLQPGMGNRLPPGETWAADNGCFAHPERFDMDEFLRWLDMNRDRERCLFAKGLHAYLSEVLPMINRQRIEEDAKWQADRR